MNREKDELYSVYSMSLFNYLLDKGIRPIKVRPREDNKVIFRYKKTDEILKLVEEYMQK